MNPARPRRPPGRGRPLAGWRLALAVLSAAGPAAAGPPSGASSCTGCHGPRASPAASLDGRPPAELVAAMAAFRTGERASTVMGRIAKGFTDDEVRAIAQWFASRPPGSSHAKP